MEGDARSGVTFEMEQSPPADAGSVQSTRQVLMTVLRGTSPVHLSKTKWPRMVKPPAMTGRPCRSQRLLLTPQQHQIAVSRGSRRGMRPGRCWSTGKLLW